MEFRWNERNVEHIANHGVTPQEAEEVVRGAVRPYPLHREDGKWLVWGKTEDGWLLQVVFILNDDTVFVIHARPLSEREKRRWRRQQRS